MRNLILYALQFTAIIAWFFGAYITGYGINAGLGWLLMLGAAAYTAAFMYANKEAIA